MDITMTEAQIKEAIVKMNNSEEYLALRKYYAEESFIKILHVSRDEKIHSNFIAWLLNPKSHHELNYYPLQKMLQMLAIVSKKENNLLAQFSDEYVDRFLLEDYKLSESCEVNTEVSTGKIAGFDKNGRIDILITLSFRGSDKILPIIIENKVLSTENDENKNNKDAKKNKQTEKYYDWAEEKYKDKTKFETPILIFLAPDFEGDINCKCDKFIKVSYQNLVDYLIEPCLMYTSNTQAKIFIENYLRCLSNSTLNNTNGKKEGRIMAFTKKEMDLLEKFHEKNKDLFDAVLAMLENDENLSPEDRKSMKHAREASNRRDNSKYSFDGKGEYPKGPVLLELVHTYIDAHPEHDASKLKSVFDAKMTFNKKPIILLESETTQKMREDRKVEKKVLSDGTVIYINKQVQIEDMQEIIRIASEQNYTIEKV